MGMERMLVPALLELVRNLVSMSETVPVQRAQCKMLAQLLMGLTPLLTGLQESRVPLPEQAVATFRNLMHDLIFTQKVMKKMKEFSRLKLLFRNTTLTTELSDATNRIQACLTSLPLTQLKVSADMREEINKLKTELLDLSKELKDSNSVRKDQQDFAAEVTEVLRAHNTAEASTSGGGAKVMDKLVAWLAQRFHSDVDTVRSEWEVLKEEAVHLREQIEFTTENKRQMEEELLQTMVYIDSEERQCATCASRNAESNTSPGSELESEPPKEFICPICLNVLMDPVVTETGFTYCRECIANWFAGNDTCPNSRSQLATKIIIDNMALRSLIARWTETAQFRGGVVEKVVGHESAKSMSSEDFISIEEFISEESERVSMRPRHIPPSSSSGPCPPKSITTYITLLGSNKSIQILKSLKELTGIASFAKGQVQILEEGGISPVAHLLKIKDTTIAEKAAGVLEALTFDIKGDDHFATLPHEQRDQISLAVADVALDNLVELMQFGSNNARMKAGQTVVNILADEEIRAELLLRPGVVSAFYALISVGEEVLFQNEGRMICVRGLNLLAGEKASGSNEEASLTVALLRLATFGQNTHTHIVEESLQALSSLVQDGGESICNTLDAHNAIPFLVRSISRLPSGRGRADTLKILSEMSLLVGMPDVIVKYDLFYHLLPVLNESSHEGDCSSEATRLLSTCLSSVRGDTSQLPTQADLKGLVGLLGLERTSVASKVDILSSLQYLCNESLSLRVAFLNSGGVATLLVLVKSVEVAAIKDAVGQLLKVLASFPSCRKDICNQGGLQLINCLLSNDSLECCPQAVIAAESLMAGPEGLIESLDGFPFESVVDLLGPTYESDCRGAAASILSVFAVRHSSTVRMWDRKVIELLLNMVRQVEDLAISARKKAAAALLTIARQDSSACPHFVEEEGLSVLLEFWQTLGTESRVMVIQLLSIFCKADDVNCKEAVLEAGGISILLEGLEKGRMKEESAVALRYLVQSVVTRKAVLQAGFIQSAIRCIQLNGGSQCSIELAAALVTVIDNKTDAESVRVSEGLQAFVLLLEGSNGIGKTLASTALTKLIRLDQEALILLGKTQGIAMLCKFLMLQVSAASTPFDNLEALEALIAASKEQSNKVAIVQEEGIPLLISIATTGTPRVQELALQILLNLSREGLGPVEHDIAGALINENICRLLFDVIQPQSGLTVTDTAVYSAICIIRNLSLTGIPARTAMLEEGEGAIKVLLDRIRHHDAMASVEMVRTAVIALERFMISSRGKMAFIRDGGIQLIVQVLHYRVGSGQAKSFATKILVMLAQDSQSSREVCHSIFDANVIPCLRDILELGPSSECKYQACILLKFLMYAGPRAAVCKKIREEQCIPKLLDLRSDVTSHQAATDALDMLKTFDRESKRQIMTGAEQIQNWNRAIVRSQ